MAKIPFNVPWMTGKELAYIADAHRAGHLSGDGPFTKRCHEWLEERTGTGRALLTTSCTAALEMAATLARVGPGDEVIMPSYTFVTTANAFVGKGAVPVFVDIRPDTLNIDETKIEAAITERTKLIVPVHYAGVGCAMGPIMDLARKKSLMVVEDAAQGILASYDGRPLGTIGHMGTLSFHESKNIICGEGGALLINDESLIDRAEIVWEKGTDRRDFYRGRVDKYTWRDVGSSYLPGDILAAFLQAQLEEADEITRRRRAVWERYHSALSQVAEKYGIGLPHVPDAALHNAHIYYLMAPDAERRGRLMSGLLDRGVEATFHYVPLHNSPGGRRLGRSSGELPVTVDMASRIVRLPLWVGVEEHLDRVIEATLEAVKEM